VDSIAIALATPETTREFGCWLGARLRPGDVVGLVGELGAGKTTLVRGIAAGLLLDDPEAVSSPTYLLVIEHPGPRPLLHADAYLPAKLGAFLEDGGLDYLLDGRCVVVIEWADRVSDLMPPATLWIRLEVLPGLARRGTLRCSDPAGFPFLRNLPMMGQTE
jgi:tRNA threonylcarbamoyladenosine biosynthesis protein TsaE